MKTYLCVLSFALFGFLLPSACGGLTLEAEASGQQYWCCNVNEPTNACTPSSSPCPNAHASSGPPAGFFASLEVSPENGCKPPAGFTMQVNYSTTIPQGWCVAYTSTSPVNGGSFKCMDTAPASYATGCAFSTYANIVVTQPVWVSYCMSGNDMNYGPDIQNVPGQQEPTICNSSYCCYPATEYTSMPAQPFTNASAGFIDNGCIPLTCANNFPGYCGTKSDGCGGSIVCGCSSGQFCNHNGLCQAQGIPSPAVPIVGVGVLAFGMLGAGVRAVSRRRS